MIRHFLLASAALTVGALLAGLFGASAVVAAGVGAATGAPLFKALRKHPALGALLGAGIMMLLVALLSRGDSFKPRCEFGDPIDLPPKTHPAGYVYVIQDIDISMLYKIGRATNPKDRLSRFAVELPFATEFVAIAATDDAPTLEWQLHQRYAEARKRGEWFDLKPSQVREICNL